MPYRGNDQATGLSRRQVLQESGFGLGSLALGAIAAQPLWSPIRTLADSAPQGTAARLQSLTRATGAKRCLILFMWGGPSQLDTWDPKPQAPVEIRGEFQPIATNVPGIEICETLPNLSRHIDKLAIIRSVNHDDPAHLSSVHHLMTGQLAPRVKSDADAPSRKDSPHLGSVLAKQAAASGLMPPFISMPWTVMHPAAPGGTAPGQNAGWLGPAYDPFVIGGDPNSWNFSVSGMNLLPGVTLRRMRSREQLIQSLGAGTGASVASEFERLQSRAIEMLTSPATRAAFALHQESREVRSRYGRHIHGQCLLLARRLLEAGTTCVCVNWHQDHANFWDTHGDNFNRLRKDLAPPADKGFSALLEDLQQRGMLDETLIVWVGEFGRRPQISPGNAGREHWPWCYSAVLAGGGIRGGQVYGKSDRHAAYPADNPVSPADLTATIYHALGFNPESTISNSEGRPVHLTSGQPLAQLFG